MSDGEVLDHPHLPGRAEHHQARLANGARIPEVA
jgi:hypothetical protein